MRLETEVDGDEQVRRVLTNINPGKHPAFVKRALTKSGLLVQRNAALKQMIRGGRQAPAPTKLTSRTGTGRRSIRVDRSGLRQFYVDIGSDLRYMQLHETGGLVSRRGHSFRMPRRAYMAPALAAVQDSFPAVFTKEWSKELAKR